MGAAGFATLAGHFTDRTVVTYDPRGVERSADRPGAATSTPDQHADDLHRLIEALDAGPVDLFASSGGAVNALALVAATPSRSGPSSRTSRRSPQLLPDRDAALAAAGAIHDTYKRSGWGAGDGALHRRRQPQGPVPADYARQPAPDPAMFGLPTEDDGSRDDVLLGQNIVTCTHYEPDFDALRAASTRIVVAAGAESDGEMAHRGAERVAKRLGTKRCTFPSDHGGFLGGEYGQTGEPEAFAARLREALTT